MKKRCVIIGGANITDYEKIRPYLSGEDFYIYCDSGLKHRKGLKAEPDLIVGDFDSWQEGNITARNRSQDEIDHFDLSNYLKVAADSFSYEYETGKMAEAIQIPTEKYDSDTMFGVREGLRRGYERFLMIGVTGERFDHTFANVSILIMLDRLHKKACIVDDYSEMEIVSDQPAYIPDRFAYFSLLNITGTARRIVIEQAKYTFVPHGEITSEHQYAISNEVLPGKTAKVTVGEGRVLLVKVF